MVWDRDQRGALSDRPTISLSPLARVHLGLPAEAPWFVRVVLRSRWFLVATIVVTLVLGGAAIVGPDWLLAIDEPISDWIRGSGRDLTLARILTQLGSPNISVAIGVIAVGVIWRRCRASALTLAALVASAVLADVLLKLLVDRPRPAGQQVSTHLGSFPSGHTIHAVVIFGLVPLVLWVLTNRITVLRAGYAVSAIVVIVVAWSRIRLGAHWPSDVLASFFIGASLLIAAEQMLTSRWAADHCSSLRHH